MTLSEYFQSGLHKECMPDTRREMKFPVPASVFEPASLFSCFIINYERN